MNKVVIAALLFILTAPLSCFADKLPPEHQPQTDSWHFRITPYGWVFGMSGTMTVRGNTAVLNTTPNDVLNALNKIDFIGELHMEANKGAWTFLLDPTYLKLTQSGSMGPIGASVSPSMVFVDFGAFYNVVDRTRGKQNMPFLVQVLGGGRYFEMKVRVNPNRLPGVSGKQDFVTPMIGARIITQLSKNWHLALRGDVGGFGIDNVRNTWSTAVIGDYSFNKTISLALGLRILGIDYSKGSAANRFAIDTRFWGPVIGITFRT